MKSKTYRAVGVKEIKVSEVVSRLSEGRVYVGIDIGKRHTVVMVRDCQGAMSRPWKVCQPGEIKLVSKQLEELNRHRPLVIAMEPTGTYGDALRQALRDVGLVVHRVSPKATSDYSEVFDGVPSQHDGKDAAVIAELASIGKSCEWLPEPGAHQGLLQSVQWMDTQQDILQLWLGRIEALLARHWPELTSLLDLNSPTLFQILSEYGGPEGVCQDAQAGATISRWGRLFKAEKVEAIVESARSTVGVRMHAGEVEFVQRCARGAIAARQEILQEQSSLKKRVSTDAAIQRVGQAVGVVTACVLFATAGDPSRYTCGAAYRKALGLNLKEESSGTHQGVLKITKRGPSLARRWLYFAALRLIQSPTLKPWYERKKSQNQSRGGKAVVAVMRKLSLAIYAVARGATFDLGRLLPGRPRVDRDGSDPKLGALPPDPRNLTHSCQSRTEVNKVTGVAK